MRIVERWQMRSAHGPVQFKIHPASTRSSFPVMRSRKQHAASPALRDIHGQHFTMIADDCSRLGRFHHPLGYQALRKFALRIFVVEDRPLMPGVERALARASVPSRSSGGFSSGEALVEPQPGAHFQGAALALFIQQEQKMHGMDQMGALAQQAFAFADRFAHQT